MKDMKLPYDHWRFRVLHWFHKIQPESPEDSRLPEYLYKNYCPLFHITNGIVLIAPVIMLWRAADRWCRGIQCPQWLNRVGDWLDKNETIARLKQEKKYKALLYKVYFPGITYIEFEFYCKKRDWAYARFIFDRYIGEVKEHYAEQELLNSKDAYSAYRERYLWWVNLSRKAGQCLAGFMVGLLITCVTVLGTIACYALYKAIVATGWQYVGWIVLSILGVSALICLAIFGLGPSVAKFLKHMYDKACPKITIEGVQSE